MRTDDIAGATPKKLSHNLPIPRNKPSNHDYSDVVYASHSQGRINVRQKLVSLNEVSGNPNVGPEFKTSNRQTNPLMPNYSYDGKIIGPVDKGIPKHPIHPIRKRGGKSGDLDTSDIPGA